MCHTCPQHTVKVTSLSFSQREGAACLDCETENEQRVEKGQQSRSVGFLRPDVLLYGEYSLDESEISDVFEDDPREPMGAIKIAGARLDIDSFEVICRESLQGYEIRQQGNYNLMGQ